MTSFRFPTGALTGSFLVSAFRQALRPVGTGALTPGVMRPGRETDQSPPSSAKFENAWSYTLTPPIRLHIVVLS